jgi:RNA-binding protein
MKALSTKRRSALRAEAHTLKPTVLIGDKGLTDEVIAEIDRSLKAHELIKVRATGEREARDAWLDTICTRLAAHAVQQIGKVFVIYRENPEEEPKRAPAAAPAPRTGVRGIVVTDRGKERQRLRDEKKRKARDIEDMVRKGKINLNPGVKSGPRARLAPGPVSADADGRGDGLKGTSRQRSRTPSPLPASGPPRRRPRTSR